MRMGLSWDVVRTGAEGVTCRCGSTVAQRWAELRLNERKPRAVELGMVTLLVETTTSRPGEQLQACRGSEDDVLLLLE
jgi:hypothetical protein